jgi:beta-fructofuranosidase
MVLNYGAAQVSSITSTTTYSQSNVPTGTPLPASYDEPLRPQVHFSPPSGFMNDPNGQFIDENGVYHLYYQCKRSLLETF